MIAVTGASGHFGRLAVQDLLKRGVPGKDILALARDPKKVADLAAKGVQVRTADFDKPETLDAALKGVKKLLFVSGNEVGKRISQHKNVVNAARKAGLELIVYTSVLRADTSLLSLAAEHKATEDFIRESGLPFVILRNGWYIENYSDQLATYLNLGAIFGSGGEGKISAAARADFAAAAGAVLTGKVKAGAIYELGGESFTLTQLASQISKLSGKPVKYQDLPQAAYQEALVKAGLPAPFAAVLADCDVGISKGQLFTDSQPLVQLIGRPLTKLQDVLASQIKAL